MSIVESLEDKHWPFGLQGFGACHSYLLWHCQARCRGSLSQEEVITECPIAKDQHVDAVPNLDRHHGLTARVSMLGAARSALST